MLYGWVDIIIELVSGAIFKVELSLYTITILVANECTQDNLNLTLLQIFSLSAKTIR